MEWIELQAMWQQYDARLAENTRINKEILKRMLLSKPEKRMNIMKGWATFRLVAFIPIICIALIPNIKFRNEWDFYTGLFLLISMLTFGLYQITKWFLLIRNIDFTNQIAKTKKQLLKLEKLKLKLLKWEFLFAIVGITGVFLIGKLLPVRTKEFIILTVLMIFLMPIVFFVHQKRIKNQLNNFNTELNEIEQLEKE